MGSSQSNPEAKWKGSMSGYRYVTNNITSNSSVKKVSYPDGSQVWGPYKKNTSLLLSANLYSPLLGRWMVSEYFADAEI